MNKVTIWARHPKLPIFVSIDGEVARAFSTTRKPYFSMLTQNGLNYKKISVILPNKKYLQTDVHRLVAETFIQYPIPNNLQVDHINEEKLDNRAENLQLLTAKENILKHQAQRSLPSKCSLSEEKAQQIWSFMQNRRNPDHYRRKYRDGSFKECMDKFNIKRQVLVSILNGKTYKRISRG